MHDIDSLATLTAERARLAGVRPNKIVRMVCMENGVLESQLDDIKSLVLSECGRRGGSKKPRAKRGSRTKPQQLEFLFGRPREEVLAEAELAEKTLIAGIPVDDL